MAPLAKIESEQVRAPIGRKAVRSDENTIVLPSELNVGSMS